MVTEAILMPGGGAGAGHQCASYTQQIATPPGWAGLRRRRQQAPAGSGTYIIRQWVDGDGASYRTPGCRYETQIASVLAKLPLADQARYLIQGARSAV
jgi:hypothetical protein